MAAKNNANTPSYALLAQEGNTATSFTDNLLVDEAVQEEAGHGFQKRGFWASSGTKRKICLSFILVGVICSGGFLASRSFNQMNPVTGAVGLDSVGDAHDKACTDTQGWINGAGKLGCHDYETNKWCVGGKVTFGGGAKFKSPERHCCACGGGKKASTTEEADRVDNSVGKTTTRPPNRHDPDLAAAHAEEHTITASNKADSTSTTKPRSVSYPSLTGILQPGQKVNAEPTVKGGEATSYSVAPSLPEGLHLDPTTGKISGTIKEGMHSSKAVKKTCTLTATNKGGSITTRITFDIKAKKPSNLYYGNEGTNTILIKEGVSVHLKPKVEGYPAKYTIAPPLPTNLSLDPTTGVISGTMKKKDGNKAYVVTASNPSGSTHTKVKFHLMRPFPWGLVVLGLLNLCCIILLVENRCCWPKREPTYEAQDAGVRPDDKASWCYERRRIFEINSWSTGSVDKIRKELGALKGFNGTRSVRVQVQHGNGRKGEQIYTNAAAALKALVPQDPEPIQDPEDERARPNEGNKGDKAEDRREREEVERARKEAEHALSVALKANRPEEVEQAIKGAAKAGVQESIIQPAREQLQKMKEHGVIMIGGMGTGKSTLLNILAKKQLFDSGFAEEIGHGRTRKTMEHVDGKGRTLIDSPGLADENDEVRIEQEKALDRWGDYKIVVVGLEDSGRINPQAKLTLLVLSRAIPQMKDNFGIIINKCGPGTMSLSSEKKQKFLEELMRGLPHMSAHFLCLPRLVALDDQPGMFKFPNEIQEKELNDFIQNLPSVTLRKGEVNPVELTSIPKLLQETELSEEKKRELQKLLDEREAEKRKKIQQDTENAWHASCLGILVAISYIPFSLCSAKLFGIDKIKVCDIPFGDGKYTTLQAVAFPYQLIGFASKAKSLVEACTTRPQHETESYKVPKIGEVYLPCIGEWLAVRHMFMISQLNDFATDMATLYSLWVQKGLQWETGCWAATALSSFVVPVRFLTGHCSMIEAMFESFVFEDIWQSVIGGYDVVSLFYSTDNYIAATMIFSLIFSIMAFLEQSLQFRNGLA